MENASKALLIAGSILIVILLIGVGMMVYNSTIGTINEGIAQMSSQEKDMFNSQFQNYEGTRVNGANVRALRNKINNNNSQLEGEDDPKFVTYSGPETINTAQTYSVVVTDGDNDGLMDTVTVTLVTR